MARVHGSGGSRTGGLAPSLGRDPPVTVDENLTIGTMRSLALSMRDVRPGDLTFLTVPLDGTGWSEDGQSIVLLDQEPIDALMDAVAADTVADHIDDNPGLDLLGGSGDVR